MEENKVSKHLICEPLDPESFGTDNWKNCSGYSFGLSTWREYPIEVICEDILNIKYKEPKLTDDVKEYLKSFVGQDENNFKNFPPSWFDYIKEISLQDPPIKVIKSKEEITERVEGKFEIKFN